jgi:hypothetical protein
MSTFFPTLFDSYILLLLFRHIPGLPNATAGSKRARKNKISHNGQIVDPVSRSKAQVAQAAQRKAAEAAAAEQAKAAAAVIQPTHETLADHDEDVNRDTRVFLPAAVANIGHSDHGDDSSDRFITSNKPIRSTTAARTGKVSSHLMPPFHWPLILLDFTGRQRPLRCT